METFVLRYGYFAVFTGSLVEGEVFILLAQRVSFVFLAGLFVLMFLVVSFLLRQILGSLSRYVRYAQRIGTGIQ